MPDLSGATTQFAMDGSMTQPYGSFDGKVQVGARRKIDESNTGATLTSYLDSITLIQDDSLDWWIVD